MTEVAEGWSGVLKQVAKGDGSTLLSTVITILREPIAGPIRLALDLAYSGHIKFYLTFVSAAFVAMFVVPQELSRTFLGIDTAGDQSLVKRMMLLQALIVLVLTPILYYVYRWRSKEQRTPLSFFKLALLTITSGNVLIVGAAALLIALWVVVVVAAPFHLPSDPASTGKVLQVIFFVTTIAALVYNTLISARFWNIHWIWPATISLIAELVLEAVAWPILNALGSGGLGFLFK